MRAVLPTARLACTLVVLAALSACGSPQPDEQEAVSAKAQQAAEQAAAPAPAAAPEAPPIGSCDATQVQSLVGQALTDAVSEQARTDAGAKSVRVLKPGQMTTMEFNGERLNLEVDAKNVIASVRCG
ncbi:Elastase inhibitor AFLEI Flags: Precursor [Xanthomonas arboricola pv. juglandis]|uniref:Elastase inhibitor AFLEI Flags n=1 Tax=Xanthomonas euroxanthea TaxID=2259622 RepID=A0A6V7MD64_9XANT|nr:MULTISPECIES: I78 family peptidase inhibitor [Xanthomonas]PPT25254.1 Elastase inhibitor AFLEI Flags: Precursor [Xanthomonas arboricola]SYZ49809.1 Elastase inhibitor AFLEI Flags: Precursor [Xanthomonas arboricola pv. juglandis]MBB3777413.1 hypothetical protein [Xanthomonas euroxanthea]MBB3813197.1 hypothetical protein [Xanthomonas euroxanthea]MBB5766105.1 hypothetical protein [Xanthomonas euroxanthea]